LFIIQIKTDFKCVERCVMYVCGMLYFLTEYTWKFNLIIDRDESDSCTN